MKFVIIYGLEFLIGLTLLTQVLIPLFVSDLPLFWLFKKSKPDKPQISSLDDLEKEVDDYHERVIPSVKQAEEKVNQIKNKTKNK